MWMCILIYAAHTYTSLQLLPDALPHFPPDFMSFIIIVVVIPMSPISVVQIITTVDHWMAFLCWANLSGYFWVCTKA